VLPIEPLLPAIADALGSAGRLVLQAPPGAGKTTLVPPALLSAPWLGSGRILLLEPRRVAARAAARRMAALQGEQVGNTVGYRIRREVRSGPRTRIEVVTEGILTRMLQSDPALDGVVLVIFDEFHERSLHADLGLALTLESRAVLRPDLRILVMSATLDGEAVSALLGGAPVLTSEGRSFPVETRYLPPRPEQRLEAAVATAVRQALSETEGDILVFLPGQAEIRRTAELLTPPPAGVVLHQLHGQLTGEAQDAALVPAPAGTRKVVLATSIAETSLTIEGVRVVVDAGLARVPRYSPRTGMTRLATVRVSRASAEQRRGRAGRTAPGTCYRLWPRAEDDHLLPRATPEILEADLAPLALELAVAGADPARLAWLDPPPRAALAEARALLRSLGALDEEGRATPHGRRMAELGTHPRLAHLLLKGRGLGHEALAARLIALLEERDVLRADRATGDADLALRLELLERRDTPAEVHGMTVDRGGLERARREARAWETALRRLPPPTPLANATEPVSPGLLLAFAYPDRLGQRRAGQAGRFLLANGQGAATSSPTLALAPYIVAADLDGERRESRLWLGLPLEEAELRRHFGDLVATEDVVRWEDSVPGVVAVRRERLGAIVLKETPLREPDDAQVQSEVLAWIRRTGLSALPWSEAAIGLRERLAFLHHHLGAEGWPDVSDAALLAALDQWLAPWLGGVRRHSDLARLDLSSALLDWSGPARRAELDRLAPTHLAVPTGSKIRVDYSDPAAPVLAVRLQEVFGLTETPRLAGGRVPVTMHLLSPAHRPVQVTRDLAGFWRTSYFDVRKEMKGRYPKHEWPEDPLSATPTRRARRKS
jgi:ATP-dependent helicase HrpB